MIWFYFLQKKHQTLWLALNDACAKHCDFRSSIPDSNIVELATTENVTVLRYSSVCLPIRVSFHDGAGIYEDQFTGWHDSHYSLLDGAGLKPSAFRPISAVNTTTDSTRNPLLRYGTNDAQDLVHEKLWLGCFQCGSRRSMVYIQVVVFKNDWWLERKAKGFEPAEAGCWDRSLYRYLGSLSQPPPGTFDDCSMQMNTALMDEAPRSQQSCLVDESLAFSLQSSYNVRSQCQGQWEFQWGTMTCWRDDAGWREVKSTARSSCPDFLHFLI